MNLILTNNTPR